MIKNKNKELLPYYEALSSRVYWENGKPFWEVRVARRVRVGDMCGKLDTDGYRQVACTLNSRKRMISASRLSWFMEYGELPNTEVDHMDLDKDNNDPSNLRLADHSQNKYNTPKYRTSNGRSCSSQYKGVSWYKEGSVWRSNIRNQGKLFYLGSFQDEKEAARAYDRAAVKLGRDFSLLNFPPD